MKIKLRHTAIIFLAFSYIIVGIGGQYIILGKILNSGLPDKQLSRERPSQPVDNRPYWTSYKHFPTIERSQELSTSILSTSVGCIEFQLITTLIVCKDVTDPTAFFTSLSFRGPPLG